MNKAYSVLQVLEWARNGRFLADWESSFRDMNQAVRKLGKKGRLTLEISFTPKSGNRVEYGLKLKAAPPKAAEPLIEVFMFADPETGEAVLTDPEGKQAEISIDEKSEPESARAAFRVVQ